MASSTAIPLPPDILFAQKASSCVKAAGMDPRQMDLNRFYELAAVIFTRAYFGIYKEPLPSIISDPQNDDDLVNNAHKIINGLISRTNDRSLMEISGRDIVSGDPRAVGILVNVLYSEGNRLWLQKLSKAEENLRDDRDGDRHVGQDPRKKTNTKSSDRRDRRVYNEGRLYVENDAETNSFDEQLDKIIGGGGRDSRLDANGGSDIKSMSDRDNCSNNDDYNTISQIGASREKRSLSPPSRSKSGHRGRIAQAQAAAVERLSSAGKCRDTLAADQSSSHHTGIGSDSFRTPKVHAPDNSDGLPYTYDMKSGRRVVMSKAYVDSVAKQRKLDALGNIKKASEIGMDGKLINNGLPPAPVRPEWPGKSTGASVDKWIKRMGASRCEEDESVFNQPRIYSAYQLMDKMDLIVSVEHCFNCTHHSLSLRHDQKEYLRNANEALRIVAQLAHESGVCARVGVTRMRARITSSCKHTDIDSRIGACEVQLAYKDGKGVVKPFLLHSKLKSRHWPSKASMEKKFRSFLIENDIALQRPRKISSSCDGIGSDGISPYPIGLVEWDQTPLGDTTWMFPPSRSADSVELNCNFDNVDGAMEKSLNIQWVYDARQVSGVVQIVHQPPPLPMAPEAPKSRRTNSFASSRPTSSNRATSVLAKLNSKSRAGDPNASFNEDPNKTAASSSPSPTSGPDLGSSDATSPENTLKQLKDITIKMLSAGNKGEYLIPYDMEVLVTRGVVFAETISSCALLRLCVTALCAAQSSNGSDVAADGAEGVVRNVFQGIDQRGVGSLNITDVDNVLILLQNRRCSDQALRLVFLSIDSNGSGEISFGQFFSFICCHEKLLPESPFIKSKSSDPDNEKEQSDELGVLWLQIGMFLYDGSDDITTSSSSSSSPSSRMRKLVFELHACAGSSEKKQNLNGICARYLFFSALKENGITSLLSDANISLLSRIFGEGKNNDMIRAVYFANWLLADGVDIGLRECSPVFSPLISPILKNQNTSFNGSMRMPDLHTFYPTESIVEEDVEFVDLELEFKNVQVEGICLSDRCYENVQISVTIGDDRYVTSSASFEGKGTSQRSFTVDWSAVLVTAGSFKENCEAVIGLTTANTDAHVEMTSSSSSSSVQLSEFIAAVGTSFQVSLLLSLSSSLVTKENINKSESTRHVKVTLSGNIRAPSEKKRNPPKSVERVKIKFDPLPIDDFDLSAPSSPMNSTPLSVKNAQEYSSRNSKEEVTFIPENSMDLDIIGEMDHQYINDDFEDPGSPNSVSEVGSSGGTKENSPNGMASKFFPAPEMISEITVAAVMNESTPHKGSEKKSGIEYTENTMNSPIRNKEKPRQDSDRSAISTHNGNGLRDPEGTVFDPIISDAPFVRVHSDGTTETDEENDDDDDDNNEYEVDFEDFVED